MKVRHNHNRQKFFLEDEGDNQATLSYNLEDSVINIVSVVVPIEFRGQGLAEKITQHVFEYAKGQSYRIVPTCPYVRNKFLNDHPEFNPIILR